jgi:hypothetical protein
MPRRASGSARAILRCPATTTAMAMANQSWAKVAPVDREVPEPVHDRPGPQHHHDGAQREGGVELLARVELAHPDVHPLPLAPPERVEPPPVVVVEAGQGAHVGHERLPPRPEPGGHQREGQGQPGHHVDVPHELPPPDQGGEGAEVQDRSRGDQDAEQRRVHPVQRHLRPVEPLHPGAGGNRGAHQITECGRFGTAYRRESSTLTVKPGGRHGCWTCRSMRRCRSPGPPSSRPGPGSETPRSSPAT